MTNLDKLEAVEQVNRMYKDERFTAEQAMEAIDKVVNPKVVTRKDVEKFRQRLYSRPE